LDVKAIETPGSPEWWLNHLAAKFIERDRTYDLQDIYFRPRLYRTRRQRMNMLWSYYIGDPPLPEVARQHTDIFKDVLRKGRATYAPMTITPMLDRMELNGVRTGVEDGVEGDDVAKRIMEYSNFASAIKDAFTYAFVMSEGYAMVIPAAVGAKDRTPLITAEDPRWCIGEPDPMNPNQLQAALKIGYDVVAGRTIAWLFHDRKQYKANGPEGAVISQLNITASSFEWDGPPVDLPELDGIASVPVVQLPNARGMGEFEPHLDLLDRINDAILQRIVITAYQSFKQRAVIGNLEGDQEDEDSAVEEIDWKDVFSADPGALWRVPEGTTFWESNPTDMTGLITAIRDDVKELAAVTSTPLHLITPDAANGSAEGAALMREGLVFKVKDRRARLNPRLVELWKMAFAFAGETDRTSNIELLWGPIESFSLAAKADAATKLRGIMSRPRILQDIMEFTPDQIEQNEQELQKDAVLDMSLGAAVAGQVRVSETTTAAAGQAEPQTATPVVDDPNAPMIPPSV
jgi:hypothetical protein